MSKSLGITTEVIVNNQKKTVKGLIVLIIKPLKNRDKYVIDVFLNNDNFGGGFMNDNIPIMIRIIAPIPPTEIVNRDHSVISVHSEKKVYTERIYKRSLIHIPTPTIQPAVKPLSTLASSRANSNGPISTDKKSPY